VTDRAFISRDSCTVHILRCTEVSRQLGAMGHSGWKTLTHYRQKLTEEGLSGIIASRWRWYKKIFQQDNWGIGKLVELFGNKITLQLVSPLWLNYSDVMLKRVVIFGIALLPATYGGLC
jgi:hypothetical protein